MEEAAKLSGEDPAYEEMREKKDFSAVITFLEDDYKEKKQLASEAFLNSRNKREEFDSKKQILNRKRNYPQRQKLWLQRSAVWKRN